MTQRISGKFVQNFGDLKTEDLLPVTLESLIADMKFAHEHNLQLNVELTTPIDFTGAFQLLIGPEIIWKELVKVVSETYPDLVPCMRWKPFDTVVTLWLRSVGEKDHTDRQL